MDVIFIGSGDAFGAGGRRQAAILARGAGASVLLDCGATTAVGLAALGVPRDSVDAIIVSHFHADHFGGIPSLLLAALHEDDRRRPLLIAGPAGIEERVMEAAAALGHPFDPGAWPFDLTFQDLSDGDDADVGPFRVRPFAVHHAQDSRPLGHRLVAGSRTIVYTGDTGWFDDLPRRARDADLLICECTLKERGFEFHLSLEELTARRAEFACGRMILTHLGPAMAALRGACAFDTADDGLVIRL